MQVGGYLQGIGARLGPAAHRQDQKGERWYTPRGEGFMYRVEKIKCLVGDELRRFLLSRLPGRNRSVGAKGGKKAKEIEEAEEEKEKC
jgi:hypothetical protein